MVEQSNETNDAGAGSGSSAPTVPQGRLTPEFQSTEQWVTTDSEPLDPDEEKALAEFLKKVSGACQRDKQVPGFVGTQVDQWLSELAGNAASGSTGEAPDGDAQVMSDHAEGGHSDGEEQKNEQ